MKKEVFNKLRKIAAFGLQNQYSAANYDMFKNTNTGYGGRPGYIGGYNNYNTATPSMNTDWMNNMPSPSQSIPSFGGGHLNREFGDIGSKLLGGYFDWQKNKEKRKQEEVVAAAKPLQEAANNRLKNKNDLHNDTGSVDSASYNKLKTEVAKTVVPDGEVGYHVDR